MMHQWNMIAPVIAFLAVVSAFGCTSGGAEFPKGTYSAASVSDERWEVVFADHGQFRVIRNGMAAVEGQYTSTADRVVFSSETGPDSCGSDTGTYRWKRNEGTLILTAVDEPCLGRRNVMQQLMAQK